jgi:hypothetical protein
MIAPPEPCAHGESPSHRATAGACSPVRFPVGWFSTALSQVSPAGLTPRTIYSSQELCGLAAILFAKEMDARVKPAHDNLIRVSTGGKCSSLYFARKRTRLNVRAWRGSPGLPPYDAECLWLVRFLA